MYYRESYLSTNDILQVMLFDKVKYVWLHKLKKVEKKLQPRKVCQSKSKNVIYKQRFPTISYDFRIMQLVSKVKYMQRTYFSIKGNCFPILRIYNIQLRQCLLT